MVGLHQSQVAGLLVMDKELYRFDAPKKEFLILLTN